jgi:carbonic anhydrase
MKLVKIIFIISLLTFSFATNVQSNDNVMDFLNDLFVDGKVKVEHDEKDLLKFTQKQNPPTDVSTATGGATTQSPIETDFLYNKTEHLENWLSISSPLFKEPGRFPYITGPDRSQHGIEADAKLFRINDAWKAEKLNDDNLPRENTEFWFRLSATHIYYASTKSDINVLGAIDIKTILNADEINTISTNYCFVVEDMENINWKLCTTSNDVRKVWVCTIKQTLNMVDSQCVSTKIQTPTVIEEKIIQPIILIPQPSRNCNDKWSYRNKGSDWECICKEGLEQSPIDLPLNTKDAKVKQSHVAPEFRYVTVPAMQVNSSLDGEVIGKEYLKIKYYQNSLRILHPNFGKIITRDGAAYTAQEIVFHTPSEHTIDGKPFPMEVQIIHYGTTENDIAKQAVLSFLFEKKPGVFNKFLDDIDFYDLPSPRDVVKLIKNDLFIPKLLYSSNDTDTIPVIKGFSFYTYQGSLTAPPCTERTIHYVASKPLAISSTLLHLFQEALKTPEAMMPNSTPKGSVSLPSTNQPGDILVFDDVMENNRAPQPLNSRTVFYWDHTKYCEPEAKKPEPQPLGHFEKVTKTDMKYFFVNGKNPSGLPGSLMVPEDEAISKIAPPVITPTPK